MKTAIVTSCDEKYIPAAKALRNSIVYNSRCGSDLFLLAHGEESAYEQLEQLYDKVIMNAEPVASPTGGEWTYEMPAMYSRVLIPEMFAHYDRVLWLDADTIVLKDLTPLFNMDLEGQPCAAAKPSRHSPLNTCDHQLENPSQVPEAKDIQAISSGVVLFDIPAWYNTDISEKINELLVTDIRFKYVVQGVMSLAIKGRYKTLDYSWNAYSNWADSVIGIPNVNILHYIGGHKVMPWVSNTKHQDIWEMYK